MACNCNNNCTSCDPCASLGNTITFPDFVANRCCNPCCEVQEETCGCNSCNTCNNCGICNNNGCGSCNCNCAGCWARYTTT